jgi:hypothetical protein
MSILAYGAVGLGLALATLSYRLLAKEQNENPPRRMILNATYVFMVFSLLLAAGGFATEYLKFKMGASDMKGKLNALQAKDSVIQADYHLREQIIGEAQGGVKALMDIKLGAVSDLSRTYPSDSLIKEVIVRLNYVDSLLKCDLDTTLHVLSKQ